MAKKKKKSSSGAGKGKAGKAKAEVAPAQGYMAQMGMAGMSGIKLGIKLPKMAAAKTRPVEARPSETQATAASGDLMSRIDFLKTAAAVVATIGTAAVLGDLVKAQAPVPSYTDEELSKTLAAMMDTIVPGIEGESVPVVVIDQNTGQPIVIMDPGPVWKTVEMPNLGAPGETTDGAAFFLQLPLAPSYVYFYPIAIKSTGNTLVNQTIASILDNFARLATQNPNARFMDLPYQNPDPPYVGRVQIFGMMDNPDYLMGMGTPPELAMQFKSLLNLILILGNYIYYSEYCNIIPSGVSGGMPVYERIVVGTDPQGYPIRVWPIIPGSAWDQMEYELDGEVKKYPGPIVSETNYQSQYTGLKVCIRNGEVKFGEECEG